MKRMFTLLLGLVFTSPAFGEELRVYAAAAVKSPLLDMAAQYEAATGHTVTCVFDTAGATEQRFHADPGATFLVTTQALIAGGEKTGKLKDGISYRLADTVGGFAAPPGSPKPDISTPEKLKAALLSARHIAFSDPARGATVGTHFMKVIESLGVKDAVLKKATLAQDGVETMRLVLEQKVDLAVTQISEIVQADKNALVGPFPAEFDLATTFSLWHRAAASSAAKSFAAFIASPGGRAKLVNDGLRPPAAAELIILTNQGATPGVKELAAAFARASGYTVTVIQEEGAALEQRINSGPADLVTGNPPTIEALVKSGHVVASTVTPFVLAGLGLAVRAGAPKPDIGTVDAYKATLLAAKSIGYSRGCSGTNIGEGIAQLGLTEPLKAKTMFTSGGPVTDFLARGDFEIGIQQTNIMVGVPGVEYVGPLPGFLNKPCPSSVALLTTSKEPDAARAMIRFMSSPEAAPLLRKTYVEPAKP